MILHLLDENRELIDIVSHFEQILWTKKYNDVGGCLITLAVDKDLLTQLLYEVKYISREDDDMVCEIAKISLNVDKETGKKTINVTGLAVSNILNRRIVWEQTNYTTTAEIYIRRLIADSIVNPTNKDRLVPYVTLGSFLPFTSERITKQVTHDNVLDTIKDLCTTYNYGFKLILNQDNTFSFKLYRGLDCSKNQSENDYVVFSTDYNNLNSLDWEIDYSDLKNVALVGGEGEGTARKTAVVGTATGIDRYEMFVDASGVSSEEGAITNYSDLLIENGEEALSKQKAKQTLNCSIDVDSYVYKEDYDLGYKVTIEDTDFGITFDATIVEVVETEDINGYRVTVNLEI